jgi:hypothetical protein
MNHGIEVIDLTSKIAALNPGYLVDRVSGAGEDRIHALRYMCSDARVYVIVADRFVFSSGDGFRTLDEIAQVNYEDGALVARGRQWIDTLVESARGTLVLFGRDLRDGAARGIVWRKPRDAQNFVRTSAATPAWSTSKAGNATAGYYGAPPREMIALSVYVSPAHFYFSFDDGLTWRRQDVATAFALHTHEVLLQPGANAHRTARLWVTGGDDPSGHGSGLICFDAMAPDGALSGMRYVLRERPGFRLVGLAGNGKHVYIGNESLAGGVLKLHDNLQSIELADFECALGKNRHDYHQMRSLLATVDGLLISGTDSYGYVSDSIRADSGGYLYVSNDEGASFRDISLGAKWVTGITCDDASFWIAVSMGREEGGDLSSARLKLLRLPKPSPYADLTDPYCAKVVVADSGAFYKMAGYPDHPQPSLDMGECTFRVDMSRYRDVAVLVETLGPGELVVESLPFYDWHPDEHRWDAVATLTFTGAERRSVALAGPRSLARCLRVRNVAEQPIRLRQVAFVGRR